MSTVNVQHATLRMLRELAENRREAHEGGGGE